MTANCYIKYSGCHKHLFNNAGWEINTGFCLRQLIMCSMCTEVLLTQQRIPNEVLKINSNIISTENMPMSQSTTSSFITHSVHLHTYSQGSNRKCKLCMLPLVPRLVRLVNSALIMRNYAKLHFK